MLPARFRAVAVGAALLVAIAFLTTPASAQTTPSDPSAAAEQDLKRNSSGKVKVRRDDRGIVHFVGTESGKPVRRGEGAKAGDSAERKAAAHLKRYGALWSLHKKGVGVRPTRTHTGDGESVVRFQQTFGGVPVLGGELAVAVDDAGNLTSVTGETTPLTLPDEQLPVSAAQAQRIAVSVTASAHRIDSARLHAGKPDPFIYDPSLLGPSTRQGLSQVWRIEVTGPAHIRHLVLVERVRGTVSLHFNQVARALERVVCDRKNVRDATNADGSPRLADCVITTAGARIEGGAAKNIADIDLAYDYAGHTASFFQNEVGVDLTSLIGSDNSAESGGKRLRATVRYCLPSSEDPDCPMLNAFWNGRGIYFGASFAKADDVVAHELVHGVTEKTAGLAYWYQSGAINESMSDVFGELIDLTNEHDVGSAQPWLLGEDSPFGAVRSMSNPPAHGDPDRMTSTDYQHAKVNESAFDNGGVHRNSGVGNKAAYLIAEPGIKTFNGQTISGIGYSAAAKIYYKALQMLTSGADYHDLFDVLPQACTNLVNTSAPITSTDCETVTKAVTATEMHLQPTSPDAKAPDVQPGCDGARKRTLFSDGFEGSLTPWARTSGMWPQISNYARSGTKSLYGLEPLTAKGEPTHTYATLTRKFSIPSGVKTYLQFDHQYLLAHWPGDEQYPQPEYHAGGRLEYSANGGAWTNASGLPWHASGAVPKTITPYAADGRRLTAYKGFGGDSHGYISSRVDVSSLAAKSVQFRWHITADPDYALDGWTLDNVALYECGLATPSAVNSLTVAGDVGKATVKWSEPWWTGDTPITGYRVTVSPGDRSFDVGPEARNSLVTGLTRGTSYTFGVQPVNANGAGQARARTVIGTALRVDSRTTTYGYGATIKGKLFRKDTGAGLVNQKLQVQGREKGNTTWVGLTTVTTGKYGAFSFYHKPVHNSEYRVVYASGNTYYLGNYGYGKVTVRQKVTGTFNKTTIHRTGAVLFTGVVTPHIFVERPIYLQRYYSGKWNTVRSGSTYITDEYAFHVSHSVSGTYKYRAYIPATVKNGAGYSPVRTLTVQ